MRASLLCRRMESALQSGQWVEVIRLGESLLGFLPGHLWAECLLAQGYLSQGQEDQAQSRLLSVLERDPECAAAWTGLALLAEAQGEEARASDCRRRAAVLLEPSHVGQKPPSLGVGPRIRPDDHGQEAAATETILADSALGAAGDPTGGDGTLVDLMPDYATPFPQTQSAALPCDSCQHAEALWRLGSLAAADREARQARRMAPRRVKPALILTDIAWQKGHEEQFAESLHQAQRLDPSGVVARRMWGDGHPLLKVVTVDPLLPIAVEQAEGQPTHGSDSRVEWGSESGEAALPPPSPPWLLDLPLAATGRGTGEEEVTQEVLLGAAEPRREATVPSGPTRSVHETSGQSQEGEVDVCPATGWQGMHVVSEGDESALTPLLSTSSIRHELAEEPDTGTEAELADIELELKRIAGSLSAPSSCSRSQTARQTHKAQSRAVPLALIASSRTSLQAKYGSSGALRVHRALTMLADAMNGEGRVEALVVYLDDAQALQPYGLAPSDPRDPEELRLTLNGLRERLRMGTGQGLEEADTYVLLIGGHDIVPFHALPNPNEDEDEFILADHPYASFADDYSCFGQAVGRLPDGASGDVGYLLRLIAIAAQAHRSPRWQSSWRQILRQRLAWLSAYLAPRAQHDGAAGSFGYSASIWRRAAREVFSSIGQAKLLRTSPPLTWQQVDSLRPTAPRFSYFNLHGVRDSAYWYGQPDPTYAADYPLFPVALKPDNIPVVPHPETIVFSEACYGAHISEKHEMSSLALRFLAAQAVGLVGSTALAYGSIAPPLVGADLLARAFWEQVRAGYPLGVALGQAKQSLVRQMMARQGYLDPEDQKTVLSFVLYGDPTLAVEADLGEETVEPSGSIGEDMRAAGPAVPRVETARTGGGMTRAVLCRRQVVEAGLVSPELMNQVRHRVACYLASACQGDVTVSAQMLCDQPQCDERCALRQSVAKGHLPTQAKLVFTLRQRAATAEDDVHEQIVKATVDHEGNLVKIAISR